MKILFLDIDGVLNTYKENYKPVDYLDKNKIALLKRIIDETKCKIVISSSWRFDKTLMESFYTQLEECNIKKDNFIGHTPHLENYYAKKYRSDEILDWLTQNTVEKFAVLDDRIDAKISTETFFRTKRNIGLNETITNKIIKYFNDL